METKSHIIASYDFYELPNNKGNNSLVIFNTEIMYTYNFHEGVTRRIVDYNENEIIIEKPYDFDENRIYIKEEKIW